MINLLPPLEKKALAAAQYKKMVVVLGISGLVAITCMALILLSLNFYLLGDAAAQKSALEELEKKYQTPSFIASKSLIEKYNALLARGSLFYSREAYASRILAFVASLQKPSGISMVDIAIKKDQERKVFKVTLLGKSATRQALQSFKDAIDGLANQPSALIANVDFPTENWIKPTNSAFRITFDYAAKE